MISLTSAAETSPSAEAEGNSLSRQAYLRLRDQIITLRLEPGAFLQESALMKELRLGRTPIREALQWLACEGLVVLRPRRGAFVANLSLADLQQIFELRQLLEGLAAGLAAQRATDADLAAMETALAGLDGAEQSEQREGLIAVDREFHRALARGAHNRFLEETLNRLYTLNLRLWYLVLDKIGSMQTAVNQHRVVLEAIKQRDSGRAEAAIREHVAGFQARVRAVL